MIHNVNHGVLVHGPLEAQGEPMEATNVQEDAKLVESLPLGDDHEVNLDKHVMIRLTAADLKRWQAAADGDQRRLADWIRVTVNNALETTGKTGKGRR
jgi:hypothetical protein